MSHPLRKAAQGQECTAQIFPYCQGFIENDTTVLAHANCEDKGMGNKSPDWWGLHACATCHDIIDGRKAVDLHRSEVLACEKRGIYRTLKRLIEAGLIKVKGENW